MHTHKFANIHVVRRITNARAGNLYLILILLSVAMPSMSEIRRPGRAEKKEHVEEEEKLWKKIDKLCLLIVSSSFFIPVRFFVSFLFLLCLPAYPLASTDNYN